LQADCIIKGKLRVKGFRTTNPVAVGDRVLFEETGTKGSGVIAEVLERKNYILRKASNLSKEVQILAANIDQLFLLITISMPETPTEFIDRVLATSEAYRIPAMLIINKTDLADEKGFEIIENLERIYNTAGYEVKRISVKASEGLSEISTLLKNKITLLAGNSGTGKSSLINILNPTLKLKTGEISEYHRQGKHITTFPEMHPLPFGGFIIDSPGIRGFGMADMDRGEVYHFFPEIFENARNCRFHNCLHLDEPGCAVREALEKGKISFSRYRSYISIVEDENSKYR